MVENTALPSMSVMSRVKVPLRRPSGMKVSRLPSPSGENVLGASIPLRSPIRSTSVRESWHPKELLATNVMGYVPEPWSRSASELTLFAPCIQVADEAFGVLSCKATRTPEPVGVGSSFHAIWASGFGRITIMSSTVRVRMAPSFGERIEMVMS